jgi:hypothetical protein
MMPRSTLVGSSWLTMIESAHRIIIPQAFNAHICAAHQCAGGAQHERIEPAPDVVCLQWHMPMAPRTCLYAASPGWELLSRKESPSLADPLALIECIIGQLKNVSQIGHSRHRCPTNFVVHVVAGLIASSHQDNKPGLHLDEHTLFVA